MPFRDHDREALDDDEFPDPEDGDETATLLCPHCRVPIYEEAEQCPYCGTYLTEEGETPPRMKPLWIVVGTVAVLVIVYFWIRHGV
jgi:hypothetical protein